MEPSDPVRNEESSAYSKRRTSILKMPRKSIKPSEVEHQDIVVECVKPSEKRISRRVSFALANDVLLFSKDAKNPSPLQSPAQDLLSGSAKQNRVQMKVTDDQQLTGIDALLKAPKQILQQKDTPGVCSERNFGEKTMIFHADELDMTQSHTVRITNEEVFLDTLHAHGEKTVMFDRSMDMTLSQTLNVICDQDVSFSTKPTSPSRFPFTTPMTPGTEFFFDKENLVPKLNKSIIKKTGASNVRSVSPEDDLDMTENNPLQCLFPQEIYMEQDKQKSLTTPKDKKYTGEPFENYSKRRSTVNFVTKGDGRSEKEFVFSDGPETTWKTNMPRHQMVIASEDESQEKTVRFSADDACMDETRSHTVKISSDLQLQPELERLPLSGDKTVRFNANDAGMDMTQCLTVNIARDLVPNPTTGSKLSVGSFQSVDLEFENFFASLSGQTHKKKEEKTTRMNQNLLFTTMQSHTLTMASTNDTQRASVGGGGKCADDTVNMDFTEAHTGRMSGDENLYHNVIQGKPSHQQRSVLRTLPVKGAESFRKSQIQRHSVDFDAEDAGRERTVRFAADEALMDVTRSHTVHISTDLKPDLPFSEKTIRFDVNDAAMDITQCHTVNIAKEFVPPLCEDLGSLPKYGEKTVRFDAYDATMDMTRSQTVKIDLPNESFNRLPKEKEKTERFNATMDETQCLTVNIAEDCVPSLHEDLGFLPKHGEKTVWFSVDDATMDMTRSQTVKIDLPNESFNRLPKQGEKTERFNAAMDETQCLTVNIATEMRPKSCLGVTQNCAADPEPQMDANIIPLSGKNTLRFNVDDANVVMTKSHTATMNADAFPRSEDKTVQFISDDGGMEVTQCLTANIGVEMEKSHSDLSPAPTSLNLDAPPALKKREPSIYSNRRCSSLGRHGLNAALKARRSVPWGNPLSQATPTPGTDDEDSVKITNVENEKGGILSIIEEKSIAGDSLKDNSMDMNTTEALPVQIQRRSILESPVKDLTPEAEEQTTVDTKPECEVEIKIHPGSPQTNTTKADEQDADKPERPPTSTEKVGEKVHSRKSRRMSLADIQSKMRRFSEKLSAPCVVDNAAVDADVPAPSLNTEPKFQEFQSELLQTEAPDANVVLDKSENRPDAVDEPLCAPTTPFKLETKQLMSRLSVVGFKPKLTRTSKSNETKTPDRSLAQAAGQSTKTLKVQVQNQTGNFDLNVSDINDEELGSYEDVSETLDTKSLDKESEAVTSFHDFELDRELQDEVFNEEFAHVNEKKRPLSDEECVREDEKRMKTSNDTGILDSQSRSLDCDDNLTTAANTQATNSSNCSHTATLRSEATFESSSMQSLFESSIEDYANDIQKKYDEGTLTMMEFFKLFHIDFVIHNPRQSVAPGRVSSDAQSTSMDLSRDRHIGLPKQLVYEADVRSLTEQVEGLKVRMCDLDKPLTLVNKSLWEEMKHFSEAEFKSFSAKLKERHNFYRKMSKAKSHEMKEALYTELIQANVEEQKKLKGSIEKADVMLKSLDDAIAEIEADVAATEGGVKSHQEELNKITEAMANNERSTSEFEIQSKQSLNKLRKVKEEAKDLKRHLNMLHTINEWKMEEITANSVIYTFLYETLCLELVYEESEVNYDERKIVDIAFKHLLDEKSQCHARLVHTLVSQFTQDESLIKKYPTSKHVPELLQDVSLVVSRSRLLGEELRTLKAWGSLRFDILDIRCLHSEIHITFSSLKTFRKFEVVFSVGLTNHLYTLQLKSFKNVVGSTTLQDIEEIVAPFTPGQKCLTKMIKNIHSSLLC